MTAEERKICFSHKPNVSAMHYNDFEIEKQPITEMTTHSGAT